MFVLLKSSFPILQSMLWNHAMFSLSLWFFFNIDPQNVSIGIPIYKDLYAWNQVIIIEKGRFEFKFNYINVAIEKRCGYQLS